jgi:hypothetical protein
MDYLWDRLLVFLGHHRAIFRGKTFHCLAPKDGGVWIFFESGLSKKVWRGDPSKLRVVSLVASKAAHTIYILVRDLARNEMEVVVVKSPYEREYTTTISLAPSVAVQRSGRLIITDKEVLLFVPKEGPQLVVEL